MKKSLLIFVMCAVVMLSGCMGRKTLEETNANAPATVEDIHTTAVSQTSPLTGRIILSPISFTVNDPENSRNISTKRIEHSYGVAKDGKPNHISVENQKFLESTGYKSLCYDTKTAEKVLGKRLHLKMP